MSFKDFPEQQDAVELLQRSLERGRLGHAYLFCGAHLAELEAAARTLAKTLNCEKPPRRSSNGLAVDSCDVCPSCRKIDSANHPDVQWVRPESKLRVITIEQMRDLMQTVQLKPAYAAWKVAVIVAADRLNPQAANAFLKTLEEPPGNSILILLSTEPQRLLETILSRCLRLNFAAEPGRLADPSLLAWLKELSETAAGEQRSLLARYRLLSVLLNKLNAAKAAITEALTKSSPLETYDDADSKLRDKWEDELTAAIEAEYRRQRADLLVGVQWWLRDIWLQTLRLGQEMLAYPELAAVAKKIAGRISPQDAMENLRSLEQTQRLLSSAAQEALVLEVGLLKLKL
jgi:DNA polymerase III subunit delta'